jgi:hypothetical protein
VKPAKALPIHAGDMDVIGYLNPRPIAVGVAWAFGSHARRIEVLGYHRRLHGINPDPAATEAKS